MIKLSDRYWEYSALLEEANASFSVSECHGFFTGLLSVSSAPDFERHLGNLFNDPIDMSDSKIHACIDALAEMTTQTEIDLYNPDMSFRLLLADDEEPLATRVSSFQDWIQGYLFGLGLAGLDFDNPALSNDEDLNHDVQEMLIDIVSIGQVSLEDLDDSEDNEQALQDLVSYVYVGVLLVCEAGTPENQIHS